MPLFATGGPQQWDLCQRGGIICFLGKSASLIGPLMRHCRRRRRRRRRQSSGSGPSARTSVQKKKHKTGLVFSFPSLPLWFSLSQTRGRLTTRARTHKEETLTLAQSGQQGGKKKERKAILFFTLLLFYLFIFFVCLSEHRDSFIFSASVEKRRCALADTRRRHVDTARK